MRCRKVRSFLSAYCSDELNVRRKLAVSEHLSTCSSCRQQEAIYRSMNESYPKIPESKVSDDFNARLLNRIAQERFAETRTKAWLPKSAPAFRWGRAVPVLVTVCLLALVTIMVPGWDDQGQLDHMAGGNLDDSYLTVQPDGNPNMTDRIHDNWSLPTQLALAERVNRISNGLTQIGSFGGYNRATISSSLVSSRRGQIPYAGSYYKVRPVIKVYVVPGTSSGKEEVKVY